MSDEPTTLKGYLGQAKDAAMLAVAWEEATERFNNNAQVAKRFAREATHAARPALEATGIAATIATNARHRPREEAERAQTGAQRIHEYATVAANAASQAEQIARAARPFVPPAGTRADLERARQRAYWAWVSCPAPNGSPWLVILRAYVEEAEAAVQAAQLVPALL